MFTYAHEKLMFGLPAMISSSLFSLGAIMTSGEVRWIYVTLAVGVMTSSFLSLLFKKDDETIRIIVGRCGLSIMLSIVGSKVVVYFYQIARVEEDVILLSGISMGVCIFAYFLGHSFLRALNKNADSQGKGMLDLAFLVIKTVIKQKP